MEGHAPHGQYLRLLMRCRVISGWIGKFGLPDHTTSDRGTAFTSQLWTSLGQLLGTTFHHTTAYKPEAKGEFFSDTAPNEDCNRFRRIVRKFTPCRQTYKPANRRYVPKDLHSSKYVFLRNNARSPPLTPPYSGPFEVVQRKKKAFLLRIKDPDYWVSMDCPQASIPPRRRSPPAPSSSALSGRPPVRSTNSTPFWRNGAFEVK
ncbi:uncharacterized protein LOC143041389 [Oratosquilla oratoria]|uniref:uncharacterized protein LOC143041389 n=1 Tax=Oratosquilla oratoria TaxID=337810 RepID=UPI003F77726C